jgi:tRNA-splicing endonuclease subunit Sen54
MESNPASEDPFKSLEENPYLPFFHVWKPVTHWTRAKWDRGSAEGLRSLPPDFWIGVVE